MSARPYIAAFALLAAGCGEPELQSIDPDVSRFSTDVRVRGDEFVETDVYLPASSTTPAPTVVFVQGGAVAADRYSWIGKRLAANGVVSVHPSHTADLAFFSNGNAADVLQSVRAMSDTSGHPLSGRLSADRATIMGHSLGGVVAAGTWIDNPDLFEHLVIWASFPAPGKDPARASEPGDRVLSIVGGEDPRVSLDQAREGIEPLDATTTLAVIDGVSHYQFADDPTPEEFEKDGTPTVELDVAHDRIFFLVDALLSDPTVLDDPSVWPDGVEAP